MFSFDTKGPHATFRAPERHLVLAIVMQEVTGLAPIGGRLEAHGRINPARPLSKNPKVNAAQLEPLERCRGFIFLGGLFLGGRGAVLVAGGKLFGIEVDENQITHHAGDDHQQKRSIATAWSGSCGGGQGRLGLDRGRHRHRF